MTEIVARASSRAELIEALGHANESAKRTLRRTPWGEENPDWAAIHDYINRLLTLLEG